MPGGPRTPSRLTRVPALVERTRRRTTGNGLSSSGGSDAITIGR